jgi:signal peptidase II
LWRMAQRGAHTGLVVSVALIFAGALGNIIDSTFYGLIFSASTPIKKAVLFPPEGGYGTLFHGSVVDMFHFPIWRGRIPEWSPFWAGQPFEFFRPVFNLADAAITVGVVLFIWFQRSSSRKDKHLTTGSSEPAPSDTPTGM